MEYAPRRKLTREFKLEAVRQVALSEKPKAQLARELGVRVGQLRTWRLEFEKEAVTGIAKPDRSAAEDLEQLVKHLFQGRRLGQVDLSQPVDADRLALRHPMRPDEFVHGIVQPHLSATDGHGRERDDLVGGGIEARRLQVDDSEVDLAPRGSRVGRRGLLVAQVCE